MVSSSSFGTNGEQTLRRLSKYQQTGVSLRTLIDAGKEHVKELGQGSKTTPTLLRVASFLHRELPIRLSRRVAELDGLPMLHKMPSVKLVREWYAQSALEISRCPKPACETSESAHANLIAQIYERHSAVLITMARGAHELRMSMTDAERFEKDLLIHKFLDMFYTSRIGIRVIIAQYLALRSCDPNHKDRIGLIQTDVVPSAVAQAAVDHAKALCERQFGVAPKVELLGRLDLSFSYVPDHLYYIMHELIKNSMRATVELKLKDKQLHEIDEDDLTPIKVVIADGEENEDVALKVSDEGGGIARSHMPKVWSYLFTTASREVQKRGFEQSTGGDFSTDSPLAGLGYGLPIARAYARYFGGDVTLMSMEGFGTDAFVYLSRLGDHDEPLP